MTPRVRRQRTFERRAARVGLLASGWLLVGAAAARPQPAELLTAAREDPEKVVTAQACGECHIAEFDLWQETPHATGFKTLHRKAQAQEIAKKIGVRLIKRDSICFDCHYTSVVANEQLRAVSGVSCESCHGAARDWIDLHNNYGAGFDHQSEPEAHRAERIAASRAGGMRRPSDLYPVVANCFHCHTVPNEELVNVGGHTSGSADFEFVEWSQGDIRHNFLDSFLSGGGSENAERPMSRKRVMYVVGRALDLEYSLRGVAAATGEGVYGRAMGRRVKAALAEVRAISRAAEVPEAAAMVDVVRGVRVVPGNGEALLAAAGRLGAETRRFLDRASGEQLAGLDPLVLGTGLPEPEVEEDRLAAADPADGDAPAAAGAPDTGVTESGDVTAASGAPTTPAATGGGAVAAEPEVEVVGKIRRRIRPASQHRTVGPGQCSGCHGPQNEWWFGHAHYRSADPFFDNSAKTRQIATLYGINPSQITTGRQVCMDCHGTILSGKESRDVLDGVSCESCHGPAGDWLEPHKDERPATGGGRRPGYAAALRAGKADLQDLAVRAEACTGCHLITDPRLLSSGHPSGSDFDYAAGMAAVRHWESPPAPAAALARAFGAALARRGPVPQVRVATLPAGGGTAPASSTGAGTRADRQPAVETPDRVARRDVERGLRRYLPRPARPVTVLPPEVVRELSASPLSEVPEGTSIEDLMRLIQERLRQLYRAVGAREGGP